MNALDAARRRVAELSSQVFLRTPELEVSDHATHHAALAKLRDGTVSQLNIAELKQLAQSERAMASTFRAAVTGGTTLELFIERRKPSALEVAGYTHHQKVDIHIHAKHQAERYEEAAKVVDELIDAVQAQLDAQTKTLSWFEYAKDLAGEGKAVVDAAVATVKGSVAKE